MSKEISPLGHRIGELHIPEKNGGNGEQVGFVWEGSAYRLATRQELLAAQQAEAEKHPLVDRLSKRKVRQLKAYSGVRYLGQPRAKY